MPKLNCSLCGSELKLVSIQEFEDSAEVCRECKGCNTRWHLLYKGTSINVLQAGYSLNTSGFSQLCPGCGFLNTVHTGQVHSRWKCLKCGKLLLPQGMSTFGGLEVPKDLPSWIPTKDQRKAERRRARKGLPTLGVSTLQRAPRASRPAPEGAIPLATLARDLNIEPKKLRSWLRKSNWRPPEEAKSAWLFSPEEAEEIRRNFSPRP